MKRMFKSIGLNIDHPETFFVQQGKITKIVSFKPNDIMEMLMECAGVAFYQEIAENSKLVMKEKSEKLDTTQQRMKVSFGPKLLLLERERAKVAEYEAIKVEHEKITNFLARAIAYKAHKTLKVGKEALLKLEKNLKELESLRNHYKNQKSSVEAKSGTDSEESKKLKAEVEKILKQIDELKARTNKIKGERDEKAFEKNKKAEKIQRYRETQALKEKEIAQAQASKESSEVILIRLKDRIEDLQQERNQMGVKLQTGGGSEDVTMPLKIKLSKLQNDLLKSRDEAEKTEKHIHHLKESIANGESSRKKIEIERRDIEKEEKRLEHEIEGLDEIVALGFTPGQANRCT